ncbi:MAG: amidinotransferase [Bacteroidetes bacterium]|nr:amidinotransferase [Bacteroidota bacterium]
MLNIYINDETSSLKSVILGTSVSLGGVPTIKDAYDPKSRVHILKGTFPKEEDIAKEMSAFEKVLNKYDVEVFRPTEVPDLNQIFSRDIGFVINNKFIVANVLNKRIHEIEGIEYILEQISAHSIIRPPAEVSVEGGDVMPWKDKIFVGYSKKYDREKYEVSRTNEAAIEFLTATFPDHEVLGFELEKSDADPMFNALHLDCCFQPVGNDQAIIFKGGFKNESEYDFLIDYFGRDNIIEINRLQMYDMFSNIFSISPEVIVSEKNFNKLNQELRKRGFIVEEIPYAETAKMEGLLRCSTLPLIREKIG